MATPKARYDIVAKDRTAKAFRSVKRGLASVSKAVFSLKTGMIALAGVAGFGLMIKASLKQVDAMGKMSRTYGVAVKDLAALELASALGGSSLTTMAKAMRNVSRNAFDMVERGLKTPVDAFNAIGISVDEVRKKMNDQVGLFTLIGEGFARTADGAAKTGAAMQLLGGRSTELLPVFQEIAGSGGLEGMRREVELFGTALSQDLVSNIEAANDSMARTGFVFKGFRNQFTAAFAPSITLASEMIRAWIRNMADAQGGVQNLAQSAVRSMLTFARNALVGFEQFSAGVQAILAKFGIGPRDRKIIKAEIRDITAEAATLEQQVNLALSGGGQPGAMFSRLQDAHIQLVALNEELRNAESQGASGIFFGARNALDKMIEQIGVMNGDGPGSLPKMAKNFGKVGDAVDKLQAKADALIKGIRTPGEVLADSMQEAAELIDTTTLSMDDLLNISVKAFGEVEKAAKKTADEEKKVSDGARDLGFTFQSAFEDAVIEGKKLREVMQGLFKDIQRIVLRQTITKPLGDFVTAFIGDIFPGGRAAGDLAPVIDKSTQAIPTFAHGGITPGGRVIVGEKGRELVDLPRGSRVTPNNQLGGGTVVQVINNTNQQADVQRSDGPDGSSLIKVIIGQVASDILGNGQVGRAIDLSRGTTMQPVLR